MKEEDKQIILRRRNKVNMNKRGTYGVTALATLLSTQIIIRSIGVNNISTNIIVIVLAMVSTLVIVYTYKNKNEGLGIKYNTVLAILVLIVCVSSGAWITIIRNYPELLQKYDTILFVTSLITFFALCIFVIIGRVAYERKKK